MHSDCREKIGVCGTQYDRHGCPSREARHIDAAGVNRPVDRVLLHALNDSSNACGFPTLTDLMRRIKPVPTAVEVISVRLLRIDHYETVCFRQHIHGSADSKVSCCLPTAM